MYFVQGYTVTIELTKELFRDEATRAVSDGCYYLQGGIRLLSVCSCTTHSRNEHSKCDICDDVEIRKLIEVVRD